MNKFRFILPLLLTGCATFWMNDYEKFVYSFETDCTEGIGGLARDVLHTHGQPDSENHTTDGDVEVEYRKGDTWVKMVFHPDSKGRQRLVACFSKDVGEYVHYPYAP